jgi:alkanesulfonate monooxygenase SsuD/methylene tetrahydromethanopterin reductase-like flavin-dependent oxidoreductase (luciferase family)
VLVTVRFVAVELLTDEQAEAYGRSPRCPRARLERFFFLDDDDRDLTALRRTDAHRLGMAVQICTVGPGVPRLPVRAGVDARRGPVALFNHFEGPM